MKFPISALAVISFGILTNGCSAPRSSEVALLSCPQRNAAATHFGRALSPEAPADRRFLLKKLRGGTQKDCFHATRLLRWCTSKDITPSLQKCYSRQNTIISDLWGSTPNKNTLQTENDLPSDLFVGIDMSLSVQGTIMDYMVDAKDADSLSSMLSANLAMEKDNSLGGFMLWDQRSMLLASISQLELVSVPDSLFQIVEYSNLREGRKHALRIIGHYLANVDVSERLWRILPRLSAATQCQAIEAIGKHAPHSQLFRLPALLQDPEPAVRRQTYLTLRKRCGVDLGDDVDKWREWLEQNESTGGTRVRGTRVSH